MHPRILVADDQPDVLEALKLLLKGEGYEVESATSPRAVLSALKRSDGVRWNRTNHMLYTHHLQAFVFDRVLEQSNGRQHTHLYLPWVVQNFPVTRFAPK